MPQPVSFSSGLSSDSSRDDPSLLSQSPLLRKPLTRELSPRTDLTNESSFHDMSLSNSAFSNQAPVLVSSNPASVSEDKDKTTNTIPDPINPLKTTRKEKTFYFSSILKSQNSFFQIIGFHITTILIPFARRLLESLVFDFQYGIRETFRNKSSFFIGCSSITVVVFSVAVLISALSITPIVFLDLAEQTSGELDFVVNAAYWTGNSRLNYTLLTTLTSHRSDWTHSTVRYSDITAKAYNPLGCNGYNSSDPLNNTFSYNGPNYTSGQDAQTTTQQKICHDRDSTACMNAICSTSSIITTSLFFIDTLREKELTIGRSWKLPPIPKGTIYVNEKFARALALSVGSFVYIGVSFNQFMTSYKNVKNTMYPNASAIPFQDVYMTQIPFKVSAIFDETASHKFPTTTQSQYFGVVEYADIFELTGQYSSPTYPSDFKSALIAASQAGVLYEEAETVIFCCSLPRYSCYSDTDFKNTAMKVVSWSSQLSLAIGYNQIVSSLPVLNALSDLSILNQFLGLIINIIAFLLSALSIFLIYSLLMVSVETKTFELGVLRMVGMTRKGLIQLILLQASIYSLPAWVIGLTGAQGLYSFIQIKLEELTNIDIAPLLTPEAILLASFLGLLAPLLASIIPIRKALSSNLRDSLDKRHSKTSAVVIKIKRMTGPFVGMSTQLFMGFLLTLFGFIIYFALPQALVDQNLVLLFDIFFGLLLCMLFGLVLLAFNVQPLVQKILLWCTLSFLYFENNAIYPIVKKNLISHKFRNRKTATMFAFSLGFIIFLSVTLTVQISNLEYSTIAKGGTSIQLYSSNYVNGRPISIDNIPALEIFLATQYPDVLDWAYASYPLHFLSNSISNVQLYNLGQIVPLGVSVIAVSPNFLDVMTTGKGVVTVGASDDTLSAQYPSLSEQLYTLKGMHSMILPSYWESALALTDVEGNANFTAPFLVTVTYNTQPLPTIQRYPIQPLAFLDSGPTFRFTKYPSSRRLPGLVSFPTYTFLSGHLTSSVRQVPIQYMYIQVNANITSTGYRNLINSIQTILQNTATIVNDIPAQLQGFASARDVLNLVFEIATLLTMLITLFSLNSCMYTNILEQTKELGVLRALGVRKTILFRIYIYEAFVLTFSAGLFGIIIGSVVGWSMSAQQALLSQRPIGFPFPWVILGIVFVCSILSAIFATAGPVWNMAIKRKIVSILRD